MKSLFAGMFALTLLSATPRAQADVSLENRQGTVLASENYLFQDESGKPVNLGQYFHHEKPVLMAFVYYNCPGACTLLLNGMIAAMTPHIFIPDRDFELVVVSIDPKDSPKTATLKKENFLKQYNRPDTEKGWHFLTTADAATIQKLTATLGFHYDYDAESGMYDHPSALFFFTQNGTLSSVLEGISFKSADFRQAIVDAATGRLGTFLERLNSYCLGFLPHTGWLNRPSRWAFVILSGLTLLLLGIIFRGKIFSFKKNEATSP